MTIPIKFSITNDCVQPLSEDVEAMIRPIIIKMADRMLADRMQEGGGYLTLRASSHSISGEYQPGHLGSDEAKQRPER